MTEVYVLDITNLDNNEYYNLLPDNFKNEVNKYKDTIQHERSTFAWYLFHNVLHKKKIDSSKLIISHNEFGKPLIENIYFSLSHSNNIVCLAISNRDVGVDVEVIEEKDNDLLAKKIMTDDEYNEYLKDNNNYFNLFIYRYIMVNIFCYRHR